MTTSTAARATLAQLAETRASLNETIDRCGNAEDTAAQTLSEIRAVLNRWDVAKKRFGDALDNAARRICDQMQDNAAKPDMGPPTGATAHGFDADAKLVGLADPKKIVDCALEARPKMSAGIKSH